MADVFSTTTINGKKCTAVPRANNAIGGQPAVSTSEPPSSTSTSSSSTSTSTSTSTSSSSSSSSPSSIASAISTPPSTSTPIPLATSAPASVSPTDDAALPQTPPPLVANPALSEATSSVTRETTTSTASSIPPQDVISSLASPTLALQNPAIINAPAPVPTTSSLSSTTDVPPLSTDTPSTSLPTALETTTSLPSSSELEISISLSSESDITEALATATQTGDIGASTLTSDAQSGASTQTSDGTEAGAAATTTMMGDGPQLESQTTEAVLPGSSQKAATGNAISNETTAAVAGGVIGGLAVVSLIGFLIWFWRKRQRKNRRSTLLTPLSAEPPFRGQEKDERQYIISRTSLGPTPFPTKLRAMVSYNYQRFRGRVNDFVDSSPSPSVNLNRGNSQFGPLDMPESRSSSRNENFNDEPPTSKGRFVDWWGRLTEDAGRGWRLQGEPKSNRNDNEPFAATRSIKDGKPGRTGSQPDFLTLLSREDQEQTTREGGSGGDDHNTRRRSISMGNGHFLGGLGLSLDIGDPFSDANAISRNSAKPAPLTVSGADNPFSDTNAITAPSSAVRAVPPTTTTGPTTYVQNIRHSRGHSVSAPGAGAGNRAGPPPPRISVTSNPRSSSGSAHYYYSSNNKNNTRESGASVESFETRRNKFRSDPFDLDRPELLRGGPAGTAVMSRNVSGASKRSRRGSRGYVAVPAAAANSSVETPRRAHVRAESYSSMYSSGVSSIGDDWSDPGPDVGPGTGLGRWDDEDDDVVAGGRGTNGNSTTAAAAAASRTRSGGSQGSVSSVGKAL